MSRRGERKRPGVKDFGSGSWRTRRIAPPLPTLALGILLLLAFSLFARVQLEPQRVARAKRWTIAGPPCPVVDARAFASLPAKADKVFPYDDASFARAFGDAYCDDIHDDGGRGLGTHAVCQFTGPAVLKVTTRKRTFYFFPNTGRATVTVSHNVASCVRGGWFNGLPKPD